MMRFISRNMITGLVTILPVFLTLYLLYWLAVSAESAMGGLVRWLFPQSPYWPGMGVVAGLLGMFLLGLLMHTYVVQKVFEKGEQLLYHMPLIKSVYRAIRDFFDYFSPVSKKEFEQVVAVTLSDNGLQVIGFVTQADSQNLPGGLKCEDQVLVYLPMSYMIGGYAVLVPRSAVEPVDLSMEEAMRFALTAGVTRSSIP